MLTQARLGISSPVSITVRDGSVIIERIDKTTSKLMLPFSEAELLTGLDAYSSHADELALPVSDEFEV